MKEFLKNLFIGEVELSKRELWLLGGFCLFAGIAIGLLQAPWTHGVTIGSNNGNNNRGNSACLDAGDDEDRCVGVCECEA